MTLGFGWESHFMNLLAIFCPLLTEASFVLMDCLAESFSGLVQAAVTVFGRHHRHPVSL